MEIDMENVKIQLRTPAIGTAEKQINSILSWPTRMTIAAYRQPIINQITYGIIMLVRTQIDHIMREK
jgi:hypothetical protein